MYTIHTLIQSLQIISPPATWWPKKFFFNIQGRQVAGETSDLVGCVCVCAVCVCRLVVLFSLPLSLFTSIHPFISTTSSVITTFFFLCRSSTVEKGELSFHPSISHPFFSNPVVTNSFSFFLYVLYLWTDWTLGNSSTTETVLF